MQQRVAALTSGNGTEVSRWTALGTELKSGLQEASATLTSVAARQEATESLVEEFSRQHERMRRGIKRHEAQLTEVRRAPWPFACAARRRRRCRCAHLFRCLTPRPPRPRRQVTRGLQGFGGDASEALSSMGAEIATIRETLSAWESAIYTLGADFGGMGAAPAEAAAPAAAADADGGGADGGGGGARAGVHTGRRRRDGDAVVRRRVRRRQRPRAGQRRAAHAAPHADAAARRRRRVWTEQGRVAPADLLVSRLARGVGGAARYDLLGRGRRPRLRRRRHRRKGELGRRGSRRRPARADAAAPPARAEAEVQNPEQRGGARLPRREGDGGGEPGGARPLTDSEYHEFQRSKTAL